MLSRFGVAGAKEEEARLSTPRVFVGVDDMAVSEHDARFYKRVGSCTLA